MQYIETLSNLSPLSKLCSQQSVVILSIVILQSPSTTRCPMPAESNACARLQPDKQTGRSSIDMCVCHGCQVQLTLFIKDLVCRTVWMHLFIAAFVHLQILFTRDALAKSNCNTIQLVTDTIQDRYWPYIYDEIEKQAVNL